MAHDDRMLSQAEIDSLLKRILPTTDEPAVKKEPVSAEAIETPAEPQEATPGVRPVTSNKEAEPIKSRGSVPPSQETSTIKMAEYKLRREDMPPSSPSMDDVKPESSPDEATSLQKTVADLSGQVKKLTAAVQTITQLEEKVKQLEAMIKFMPDSNQTLKDRIDEISNVLEILQNSNSDHTFLEGFKCSHCRSEGLVALYVKCTRCGKESWMGWWPDERKK